jgi:ribosome biogenesis GTPase
VKRGTIRRTGGGVYVVALDDGRVVEASLRGRLKKEDRKGDRVVIGDRVAVGGTDDGGFTVEAVEERRTEVVRRGAGRRRKVVAANVDRLVAVVACADPTPHRELADRLLVLAETDDVEGVLVVNKVDLPGADVVAGELAALYRSVGYRTLVVSAVDGAGLSELAEVLCSGTSALAGPSGVGKSSLLNALQPDLRLRTGELSRKVGRGRHTTVNARLIPLECGGLVADTPGFGDVGVWGLEPRRVDRCFPEMRRLAGRCRFPDCAHLSEPDCAVVEAVEAGEIAPSRYRSYRILREEALRDRPTV